MYPATMQKISAEQGREMREQAAAWRRAQQARGASRARSGGVWFTLIARNTRSLAGQRQRHSPAAA